jgi:transposase, IS5 family
LGSLIIKERLGISDRETVEQIKENPYLQYFLGIAKYSNKAPFEASMLVHFRQRIGEEIVNRINRKIVEINIERVAEENPEKKSKRGQSRKIKAG